MLFLPWYTSVELLSPSLSLVSVSIDCSSCQYIHKNFRTLDATLLLGHCLNTFFPLTISCFFFVHKSHFQLGQGKTAPRTTETAEHSWVLWTQVVSVHWHCLMANMPPTLTEEIHFQALVSTYSFCHETFFFYHRYSIAASLSFSKM